MDEEMPMFFEVVNEKPRDIKKCDMAMREEPHYTLFANIPEELEYYKCDPKKCLQEARIIEKRKHEIGEKIRKLKFEIDGKKTEEEQLLLHLKEMVTKSEGIQRTVDQHTEALKQFDLICANLEISAQKYKKKYDEVCLQFWHARLVYVRKDHDRLKAEIEGLKDPNLEKEVNDYKRLLDKLQVRIPNLKKSFEEKDFMLKTKQSERDTMKITAQQWTDYLNALLQEKQYTEQQLDKARTTIMKYKEDQKSLVLLEISLSQEILKLSLLDSVLTLEAHRRVVLEAIDLGLDVTSL